MTDTVERASARSISKIWILFTEYERVVNDSKLSPSSKVDYIMFAAQFIRWIDGDFIPGGTLRD